MLMMSDPPRWKPVSFGLNPGEMAPMLASTSRLPFCLARLIRPAQPPRLVAVGSTSTCVASGR